MTAEPGQALRIAMIAGEESGDILGADLAEALGRKTGRKIELIGVGGTHLQAMGMKSLFDPDIIAIMGVSAVVRDLPRLVRRIGTTARAIARAKPDCLVTIDSPAFNLRVARKVRALDPTIPIVKYVCPSVWAWGEGRATRMKAYTDHVLCLLPFEPDELKRLDGPPGTFVGHRLTHDPGLRKAASRQKRRKLSSRKGPRTLLVLPGSRKNEIKSLCEPFGQTLSILNLRGHDLRVIVPTVGRVQDLVRQLTSSWPIDPEIVVGNEEKWAAFGEADAALAASGTVTLELALAGVPTVAAYKGDRLWRMLGSLIHVWSALLPNLIADRAVVPEYFQEFVRPGMLARRIEALLSETHDRASQLEGFAEVSRRMKTTRPAGDIAADAVIAEIRQEKAG